MDEDEDADNRLNSLAPRQRTETIRRAIVRLVEADKPFLPPGRSVREISEALGLTRAVAARHLEVLALMGAVRVRNLGRGSGFRLYYPIELDRSKPSAVVPSTYPTSRFEIGRYEIAASAHTLYLRVIDRNDAPIGAAPIILEDLSEVLEALVPILKTTTGGTFALRALQDAITKAGPVP